ncbi:MAG: hypothetical protein C0605_11355 [Hyphomicrobiales bacterium]|nr:MAG: hypothetical protein C0605_11355 [Hyphomicrobiales bacterium]
MSKPIVEVKGHHVSHDIAALKRQYEQTRLNAVRAQMAEREMELRTGEVIDGALYLLQKPLNVIKAMSDNLKRQSGNQLPMGIALDEALTSGQAAIQSLRLALPGDRPAVKAPVNLNEIIRDVLVISADRLSANGVVVDWRPQPDLPMVYADENALRILLRILLNNALLAVSEPGSWGRSIHFDTRLSEDGLIEACIRDTGPGIKRGLHSKIFEPFYTSWSGRASSSGMGLAIAQQIVGDLRGDITIKASDQPGCTICISIPACKARKFE